MLKHYDAPNSPGWHARRATCYNAGDAPAMLGCSALKTRTQLIHELHTGLEREFSDFVQERVLDQGHKVEAVCRAVAEEILGEELQVLAGTLDVGLDRPLGASLDGMTFMEDVDWECKSLNAELRAALPHVGRDSHKLNDGKALPKDKRVQMEQQLLVTGAVKSLFTAAKLDAAGEIEDERHAWYYPDPALRAEILAGWKQFAIDRAAYVPPERAAAVVAAPVAALPAVMVKVTGEIEITDNFAIFEVALRDFLEHRLIRAPKTDQDFADLDVQIKAMKGAEAALESAEVQMLAQIQTVDQAAKTKAMLQKLVRDNRLLAEKLLASEKERRRTEIVAGGSAAFTKHFDALNARLGKAYMPAVAHDFAGCVKGLKSLSSMEDRVAGELARAKIAANEVADRIHSNLEFLREHASEHKALFPDAATIVLKAPDDLQVLVRARIAEHKAAEQKRLDAERDRIREEERVKAEKEAREKLQREQDEARRDEENRVAADTMSKLADAKQEGALPLPVLAALEGAASMLIADLAVSRASDASKPVNVVQLAPRAAAPVPAAATPPTLKLGEISRRIAPLSIDAAGLAELGFTPSATEKSAKLFHEREYPLMLAAMVQHLESIQAQQAA